MRSRLFNMTSLTDIVSNSIGILVLLALLTLFNAEKKVYKVDIPIEHQTGLAPAFFLCKDDAVLYLDTEKIFFERR